MLVGFRAPLRLAPATRLYGTRRIMAGKLRYLLVLDFEATCGESEFPRDQMEVIEFPTLVYDLHERKEAGRFHEYVRPVLQPRLTEFCAELTGIAQVSSFRAPRVSFKVTYSRSANRKQLITPNLSRLSGTATKRS